jgi:hypothetical protein
MPDWLASLTKSAAWLGGVVLLLAALTVGYQAGQWTAPEPSPQNDTVTVAEPMRPGDILEATTPTQVTEHDTSETRTECIQVPTWLARSTTSASSKHGPVSDSVTQSGEAPERQLRPSFGMPGEPSGPTYAITPLTQGSPSLSVGRGEVTLSGYLPTGEGRQWTYRIPQDSWHLWPSVSAATTPSGLQAAAEANLRWKRVTVSAGYMQAASRRGVTFSVELRPFTISW